MLSSYHRRTVAVFTAVAALACFATAYAQDASQTIDADRKLAETLATIVRAFNAHDAAAVGKLWKPDAVHVAKATGIRTTGRQAIQGAYADLFKTDPKCQLQITSRQIRYVTPTVVNLDCIADVRHTNGDVSRSEFSAILVQDAGGWLIDQVQENDAPILPAAAAQLGRLGWLLGNWVDQSKDGRVTNETHWAAGDTFLVRSYQMEQGGSITRHGMQIIGWDAEQRCIRSWLFDASGSFGEGTWLPEGDNKWVNKLVLKLADGRRGSSTQVFRRVDDNKLTVETIDREIDGQAQPNAALITLVRTGVDSAPAANPTQPGNLP